MADKDIFKKWKFACLGSPSHKFEEMRWLSAGMPKCPECGNETEYSYGRASSAPAVIGDEIDIWIKHGLVEADGSPKHFTSKAAIRAEAAKRGLVISGETPKMSAEYADKRAAEDARFGFTYKR